MISSLEKIREVRSEKRLSGMDGRGTEDVSGNDNAPYATMVDVCRYTFVQTLREYNTKREA